MGPRITVVNCLFKFSFTHADIEMSTFHLHDMTIIISESTVVLSLSREMARKNRAAILYKGIG